LPLLREEKAEAKETAHKKRKIESNERAVEGDQPISYKKEQEELSALKKARGTREQFLDNFAEFLKLPTNNEDIQEWNTVFTGVERSSKTWVRSRRHLGHARTAGCGWRLAWQEQFYW